MTSPPLPDLQLGLDTVGSLRGPYSNNLPQEIPVEHGDEQNALKKLLAKICRLNSTCGHRWRFVPSWGSPTGWDLVHVVAGAVSACPCPWALTFLSPPTLPWLSTCMRALEPAWLLWLWNQMEMPTGKDTQAALSQQLTGESQTPCTHMRMMGDRCSPLSASSTVRWSCLQWVPGFIVGLPSLPQSPLPGIIDSERSAYCGPWEGLLPWESAQDKSLASEAPLVQILEELEMSLGDTDFGAHCISRFLASLLWVSGFCLFA